MMNVKAAEYVRMSTDQQPMSIEIQRAAIATFAAACGYEIVRTYCDEARSGVSLAGRAAMQQLLRDVMSNGRGYNVILVLDVSRWGRFQDSDEAAYYEYHCRKHGVSVQYVAEPFGTTSAPLNAILKNLKRAMAGEYSRELGAKVRAGHMRAVESGYATGSLPCVGYRRQAVAPDGTPKDILAPYTRKPMVSDHVKWVLGPQDEQDLVRQVFSDFVSGISMREVARCLNERGKRSHSGRLFTDTMIKALLRNEIVTGVFRWGARMPRNRRLQEPLPESLVVKGMVPALVSDEQFAAAQGRYASNSLFRKHGHTKKNLLEQLREALVIQPSLLTVDFRAAGLPQPKTYAKYFGSTAAAYAAAGRTQSPAELDFRARFVAAMKLRKALTSDIYDLLGRVSLPATLKLNKNMIIVGDTEVKVCAARHDRSEPAAWHVAGVASKRSPGRWLLVLRLNPDGATGRDFFLLPPALHATFGGWFTERHVAQWRNYQANDAQSLAWLLRNLSVFGTVSSTGQRHLNASHNLYPNCCGA